MGCVKCAIPNGCAVHHILDEDFAELTTVSSRSPLKCTGVHDFRILDNGGYLLMSYEPEVDRDLSHITLHESRRHASSIA